MEAGAKVHLIASIRSPKTGQLLPREGKLLSISRNLGRTLFLVEFANGEEGYMFENEIEVAE